MDRRDERASVRLAVRDAVERLERPDHLSLYAGGVGIAVLLIGLMILGVDAFGLALPAWLTLVAGLTSALGGFVGGLALVSRERTKTLRELEAELTRALRDPTEESSESDQEPVSLPRAQSDAERWR